MATKLEGGGGRGLGLSGRTLKKSLFLRLPKVNAYIEIKGQVDDSASISIKKS